MILISIFNCSVLYHAGLKVVKTILNTKEPFRLIPERLWNNLSRSGLLKAHLFITFLVPPNPIVHVILGSKVLRL
jgi:hypothetical protein